MRIFERINFLTRRLILLFSYLLFLFGSYLLFAFKQICVKLSLTHPEQIKNREKDDSTIPSNIAIVIDEYSPVIKNQLVSTIRYLIDFSYIRHISLFFNGDPPLLTFDSPKVQILSSKQNDPTFLEVMESKKALSECYSPFPEPLDLVIIYSKYPQLCNFFTWTLDLATLYFAGPAVAISPLSVSCAFDMFCKEEQRHGK